MNKNKYIYFDFNYCSNSLIRNFKLNIIDFEIDFNIKEDILKKYDNNIYYIKKSYIKIIDDKYKSFIINN